MPYYLINIVILCYSYDYYYCHYCCYSYYHYSCAYYDYSFYYCYSMFMHNYIITIIVIIIIMCCVCFHMIVGWFAYESQMCLWWTYYDFLMIFWWLFYVCLCVFKCACIRYSDYSYYSLFFICFCNVFMILFGIPIGFLHESFIYQIHA